MLLHEFDYDPFQRKAIEVIDRNHSLFVAAPTGAGKTVLADYVIERALALRQRVIYTAPIKALSNQKFRDFAARHGERVGIMTGDVTINPTAPLVIMTTEIYRNTLLEDQGRLRDYAWIIFDEIHYLDDAERGTVWEESLLFTPAHIRLLCLSATVPNVEELARWIRGIHQRSVEVIEETRRPVPLSLFFQCQNSLFDSTDDLKRLGYRGEADWRLLRHSHGFRRRFPLRANRLEPLIQELQEKKRLPCIFFTFGRRRAEELAFEIADSIALAGEERAALRDLFDKLCERFRLRGDRSLEALSPLIDRGVGFHHAGMLPLAKEVMERCFTSRRMKVIVTTETFALGINMPARSVVLDDVKKRADSGFELLRRREFLQMAGRAGRRGMDEAGFVYLRLNPLHVSHPELLRLLQADPEPIRSRFNMTYATLLNLYRRHGRGLLSIFPKTLFYAQTSGAERQRGLDLIRRKLDLLESMGYLLREALSPKGEFGSWIYGYELLLSELYAQERLAELDAVALAVLMAALVYEPRPRTEAPKPHPLSKRLVKLCREPLTRIHQEERRFRIHPLTKAPAYHLSHAMEAWANRAPFERLSRLCDVDEGEIVRYFRMAVQLLRQLAETPAGSKALRSKAEEATRRVNRDLIDAETQLRLG